MVNGLLETLEGSLRTESMPDLASSLIVFVSWQSNRICFYQLTTQSDVCSSDAVSPRHEFHSQAQWLLVVVEAHRWSTEAPPDPTSGFAESTRSQPPQQWEVVVPKNGESVRLTSAMGPQKGICQFT